MRTKRPLTLVSGIIATSLLLAACGGDDGDDGGDDGGDAAGDGALSGAEFTVGSKDFTEQLVLGQIILQTLEANGADVNDQIGLAGTDATWEALRNGDIDIYAEYSGTLWINHLGETTPVAGEQEQYDAAAEAVAEEFGVAVGPPAEFNNTYALAIRAEDQESLGVSSLSDLVELQQTSPDDLTICVENEFLNRDDGLPALVGTYGLDEIPDDNLPLLDTGVIYNELDGGGTCNFGEVFTTDGRIQALDLLVLEDDDSAFPSYLPAPVVLQETLDANPEVFDVLEPVFTTLDADTMIGLNGRVDVDGEEPSDVATDFLESNDLLP